MPLLLFTLDLKLYLIRKTRKIRCKKLVKKGDNFSLFGDIIVFISQARESTDKPLKKLNSSAGYQIDTGINYFHMPGTMYKIHWDLRTIETQNLLNYKLF